LEKVFVSHSSEDRELVEVVVVPSLHDVGLDTWYSKANIRASEQWERSIVRGLESCQWFVVAMTPSASLSPWVRSEVHWAVEHRWGRIVPLLLKDCNPLDFHLRMPELQYIDFRGHDQVARQKLREAFVPFRASPQAAVDRSSNTPATAQRELKSVRDAGTRETDHIPPVQEWVLWLEDRVQDHPLAAALASNGVRYEVFQTVSECCVALLAGVTPHYLIVDQAVPLAPGVDFPPPYGGLLFLAWAQRRLDHLPDVVKPSLGELLTLIGASTAPPALQNVPVLLASQYRSPTVDAFYQQTLGSQPVWIDARANSDAVVRRIQLSLRRTS
jgi:hypothetical protein